MVKSSPELPHHPALPDHPQAVPLRVTDLDPLAPQMVPFKGHSHIQIRRLRTLRWLPSSLEPHESVSRCHRHNRALLKTSGMRNNANGESHCQRRVHVMYETTVSTEEFSTTPSYPYPDSSLILYVGLEATLQDSFWDISQSSIHDSDLWCCFLLHWELP